MGYQEPTAPNHIKFGDHRMGIGPNKVFENGSKEVIEPIFSPFCHQIHLYYRKSFLAWARSGMQAMLGQLRQLSATPSVEALVNLRNDEATAGEEHYREPLQFTRLRSELTELIDQLRTGRVEACGKTLCHWSSSPFLGLEWKIKRVLSEIRSKIAVLSWRMETLSEEYDISSFIRTQKWKTLGNQQFRKTVKNSSDECIGRQTTVQMSGVRSKAQGSPPTPAKSA